MKHSIVTNQKAAARYRIDTLIAVVLFATSAGVVIWQNSRLTILWDVSYILENATRIAAGDLPYRDFPFPYAPLTFLIQALIIRLFGRAYWHHIIYTAFACGASSVITFAIIRRLVQRSLAAALSAPICVLGIYCILPIPFYDPDCCLAIVALIAALLAVDGDSFLVGVFCVVPLLIKQNIGLAFVAAALILFALLRQWRSFSGVLVGLTLSAAAVAAIFGLDNYIRWTIRFASERRLPPLSELLSIYNDFDLWWWIVVGVAAIFFRHARWLIVVPFLWSEYRFFFSDDPNEAEINFLRFWPLFLILGVAQTLLSVRTSLRRQECLRHTIVPLLIIAAVHGAFLSQVTWGSTYGIWPLLFIVIAFVIQAIDRPLIPAAVMSVVLLHFGVWYVWNNKRLAYASWNEGAMHTSSIDALRGLHVRGEWLPEFEELVAYSDAHIPRSDAILCLPGEDLFYFATGRRPRVPVLMFDRTVNPYSPAHIAAMDVQWVVVKRRLQIHGDPYPELDATLQLMRPRFSLVARLKNYDVYRRVSATAASCSPISRTEAFATVALSKRTSSGS